MVIIIYMINSKNCDYFTRIVNNVYKSGEIVRKMCIRNGRARKFENF